MHDTLQWVVEAVGAANGFLTTPSPLRAVVFGWLVSWAVTQALKFAPWLRDLTDDMHRSVTRLTAFDIGAVVTAVLWPGAFGARVMAGVLVGWFAPAAYAVLVRVLYHFFPWLEPHLSARPANPEP